MCHMLPAAVCLSVLMFFHSRTTALCLIFIRGHYEGLLNELDVFGGASYLGAKFGGARFSTGACIRLFFIRALFVAAGSVALLLHYDNALDCFNKPQPRPNLRNFAPVCAFRR